MHFSFFISLGMCTNPEANSNALPALLTRPGNRRELSGYGEFESKDCLKPESAEQGRCKLACSSQTEHGSSILLFHFMELSVNRGIHDIGEVAGQTEEEGRR